MTTLEHFTWMHIGAGSFHRAHQAWYLHRLLLQGDLRWSIALGNIRDDANPLLETLAQQNGEYVLETVTPAGERSYEKITSLRTIIPWDPQLSALVEQGADAATRVISFTVTEGGYYLDTHFRLDQSNADIQADLQGGVRTIYGAVAHILRTRRARNSGGVTLLSCDNVRHNGERFHDGLSEFLTLQGEGDLLAWVNGHTTTPNTMVDRITPRPAADIAARVKEKLGVDDRAPVMGESFIQWVVEDNFIAGRPALENVAVEMVDSVAPYEEAKIRILNASHSCIAWAGTLIGQSYIHESTGTDAIRRMAYDYVTEDVIPSLTPSPLDLGQYRDVVLERFGNPYIRDTNQRVAADGFSKIPGFITPTLIECYARGQQPRATAALPALFFIFMRRWHEGTLPYDYQDGILDEAATHAMFASADPLAGYARDEKLFGPLAAKEEFEQLLRETVARLDAWARANAPLAVSH
ncbi:MULTISPECIES: D-arabinitol 4-dehydrogenase [unclassified Brenneria]|uniref:D-arabinitol 4-dehydrogenase n=1 Tax=unclassified Brenneria TaxID=2634434 RepID=UPI0029C222D3|nr:MULTISPECIES: D-arabinitol 4-dehydrogenase [unclassified Brenneria]MDX5627449.1 D-arabinitol 4-dehydrogenase [Brenneria sp. L3-3Z]MDX5694395.1 D-arabinitol 4-dehydrogenase [Brenneria sp. L4-2C]